MTPDQLPADWRRILAAEFDEPYFADLAAFVTEQRREHVVFPPEADVFSAFGATPFKDTKVLLLGQDPYHGKGQAHGMCFSVRPGVRPPPSLVNMLRELHDDLGCQVPNHGNLQAWAERGVLLLNAVLTVRQAEPNSHKSQGWEKFTDAVLRALNDREEAVVFVLWGGYAQKKAKLVTNDRHHVVKAAHPSPLSAAKFLGSKPYSAINAALRETGQEPIDWQIPTDEDAMNDRPAAAELVEAVRGFLEAELIPSLTDARLRFQALVAANILGVAARELHGEEAQLREEWHLLAPLLGTAGDEPRLLRELRSDVRRLNEGLCTAIRSGALDDRFVETADVVRRLVLRKLEVANPRHRPSAGA